MYSFVFSFYNLSFAQFYNLSCKMSITPTEQSEPKLRNRLVDLLREKQKREGRKITYTEIANAAFTSVNVISQWAKNNVTRFDAPIVVRLCLYFECQVGDLLYLETIDSENDS